MPFTPAHASIVLPLLRIKPSRVSATALVIGSMAPDFEYFIKMSVNSEHSHTLLGILYFDIPVTIVLAFIFHVVVKRNLITNLPAFIQTRMNDLLSLDFKQHFRSYYGVVIISAAMGAFSHILWDAFTHNDGFFATRIDVYKHVFIPYAGVRYPLFYALQHISTFVGLAVIIGYILFMKPQKDITVNRPSVFYWLLIILVFGCVIFLRFYFNSQSLTPGNFVVSSISAILVAFLVGGWVKFKRT
jgi:Domain of unknown function (DUF4184)